MNTHADKTTENKSQSISTADSQMQSSGETTFQFVDNRPEAVLQWKLQEMANNSPQVSQLRAFPGMVENSSRVMQMKAIREIAKNLPPTPAGKENTQHHKGASGFVGKSIQLFKSVVQFVKPRSKADAQTIIDSTGSYYKDGTIGGGKVFENKEGLLPSEVTYIEYDVNVFSTGVNRGKERLVKGSDSKIYYTDDHYKNFSEL
jgi:guanyl-specific ribonuclease Sa